MVLHHTLQCLYLQLLCSQKLQVLRHSAFQLLKLGFLCPEEDDLAVEVRLLVFKLSFEPFEHLFERRSRFRLDFQISVLGSETVQLSLLGVAFAFQAAYLLPEVAVLVLKRKQLVAFEAE